MLNDGLPLCVQGDSGGPMVWRGEDNSAFVQIGKPLLLPGSQVMVSCKLQTKQACLIFYNLKVKS
jgi:hypothetical protein